MNHPYWFIWQNFSRVIFSQSFDIMRYESLTCYFSLQYFNLLFLLLLLLLYHIHMKYFKGEKFSKKISSSPLTCWMVFSAAIHIYIQPIAGRHLKRWFRTDWRTKRIINAKRHFISEMWYRCLSFSVHFARSLAHIFCRLLPHTYKQTNVHTHDVDARHSRQVFNMLLFACALQKMWFVWRKLGLGNRAKEMKSKFSNEKNSAVHYSYYVNYAFVTIRKWQRNLIMYSELKEKTHKIDCMQFKRKFSI